ncbi:unnamed protein product [Candida verbasci]|uniref:GABA-specific permease n=1 Tax=Candida verbasci TaxID=1227364 RepID=A0A9W4TT28_9ASCO|nr:unnamed protein product [Candida verbasci]
MNTIKSVTSNHLSQLTSVRSEIRHIDPKNNFGDVDLLAQIGYKQELKRHYSTLQVFGIAFSIMGLLPSISSTINTGLEAGSAGLVWGWFLACIFIFSTGTSLSFLGSSMPTSGGLYYYTNYYSPQCIRVPLSFMVGCSNSLGLIGGSCAITYGLSTEILSAVSIARDGNFDITPARCYGIYVGAFVLNMIIASLTTKHCAKLQSISIVVNVVLVLIFIIAVPIGVSKHHNFNSGSYIFTKFENSRNYSMSWSFALSWMPAIWTIGSFDSPIHCSEEAKNAQKSIPVGILGSIGACWVLGWIVVIVCALCIKNGNVEAVLASNSGNALAQICADSLGKGFAVAMMSLIAFGQFLMAISIMIALSRQVWSFARDDGLPLVSNIVKYVNPKVQVPINATFFSGILGIILGLLVLIGPAGSGALFSLGIASNTMSFLIPIIASMTSGRKRFVNGPFWLGKYSWIINFVTVCWLSYTIVLCMFPDNVPVTRESMNYTAVINPAVWIISLIYYYVWGYKSYTGPKSNLDDLEGVSVYNVDEVLDNKY